MMLTGLAAFLHFDKLSVNYAQDKCVFDLLNCIKVSISPRIRASFFA